MTCRFCHDEIYEVPQHTGPDVLVHKKSGLRHCNTDWEIREEGTVATPMEAKAK
jgi:hypothetical protein